MDELLTEPRFYSQKRAHSIVLVAAVLRILADSFLNRRAKSLILFVCIRLRRTLDPADEFDPWLLRPTYLIRTCNSKFAGFWHSGEFKNQ